MGNRRTLLVGPAFHGYTWSLARGLEAAGFEVAVHHYDENATLSAKARTKLIYELPGRLGSHRGDQWRRQDMTSRAIRVLRRVRPSLVLVVRGDVLGADFWQAAEECGDETALWLYDEVRRMHHDPATFRRVDHLISYSPLDVQQFRTDGITAHCIADAFDHTYPVTPEPVDGILFVGARYPNREAAMTALKQADVPVLVVGRDWSRHPFDRARTWQWRRPALPALRDVSRGRAYNLMAGASGSVNIHSNQDGFTMRTFETGGVGGFQLIDRPDVGVHYEPGREVAVFHSHEELVHLSRRAVRDPAWARSIAEAARRRTLAEHTFVHRARDFAQIVG